MLSKLVVAIGSVSDEDKSDDVDIILESSILFLSLFDDKNDWDNNSIGFVSIVQIDISPVGANNEFETIEYNGIGDNIFELNISSLGENNEFVKLSNIVSSFNERTLGFSFDELLDEFIGEVWFDDSLIISFNDEDLINDLLLFNSFWLVRLK